MTKPSWLLAAAAACAIVTGCQPAPDSAQTAATPRPQQAAQPSDPAVTASHIIAAAAAALAGDRRRALRAQLAAMQRDQLREMRIAAPSRHIDPEAARTAVRPLAGIRSSTWIDRICLVLEPLSDTLGVTVHPQDMIATTSEGADSISRNCKLEKGGQPLRQPRRQVDALDMELKRTFRARQWGVK